jgi:hypothetical protein
MLPGFYACPDSASQVGSYGRSHGQSGVEIIIGGYVIKGNRKQICS